MAKLFKDKVIKQKLEKYKLVGIQEKAAKIQQWLDRQNDGSLYSKTESQCEQAFNQNFFIELLGYTTFPQDDYSLEAKAATETSAQKPDAILGYNLGQPNQRVSAVVEIKDANTPLDKSQRREGSLSPVQQGFKYKPQYQECDFVIVTNFVEIRLYRDNQLDFELFTLEDLVNPDDDYFVLRKFYYLLSPQNFISHSTSNTVKILTEIRVEQKEIKDEFYLEYKALRLRLIDNIIHGSEIDDITVVIEKAQKILDRIVFIAFCEDLELLPENKLLEVVEYGKTQPHFDSVWAVMKGLFEAIDRGSSILGIPHGYNGELFKPDEVLDSLHISDEVCEEFVNISKYDFSEDLPANILGHIFEQSISDLERLRDQYLSPDDYVVTNKQKKDGIFYTPEYIVSYIIENSLGVHIAQKEEELLAAEGVKTNIQDATYDKRMLSVLRQLQTWLANIKVLDPACGSGAFLVRVYDYLLDKHVEINRRISQHSGAAPDLLSDEDYIKSILQNNIYGVDLNYESVEITKLSLWLKTAAKDKKLTTLKNNIKCGNSLVDDPEIAGKKAFDWHQEFPEIMNQGGFDVVVGNPPYVSYYSKQSQSDKGTKELLSYLKEKYAFILNKKKKGRFNTVMFFIEKAVLLLKKRGTMSYIVDTSIHSNPYEDIRRYLVNYTSISKITNSLNVFDGVASAQTIISAKKCLPKHNLISYDGFHPHNKEFHEKTSQNQSNITSLNKYSFSNPKDKKLLTF